MAHFLCKRAGLPSLLNNSTCRSSCCCCCCCCYCCCQTGNGNQIWTISTLCCAVILPSSWPPFLSLLTNQMRAKRSKYRGDVIVHFLSVLKDDADLATNKSVPFHFSIYFVLPLPTLILSQSALQMSEVVKSDLLTKSKLADIDPFELTTCFSRLFSPLPPLRALIAARRHSCL